MRNWILVINIYYLFTVAYAGGQKIRSNILSFNQLQSRQHAYINFFKRIETQQQYDKYQEESFSLLSPYLKSLWAIEIISHAYGADGDLCFFGGWPSKTLNNICRRPWVYQNDSSLQKYGPTYSSDFGCGGKNTFRCNPSVFGSPREQGDKGHCVDTGGTFVELTQKCEEVSRETIAQVASEIKSGSEKGLILQERLAKMNRAIFGADGKMTDDAQGDDAGFCDTFRTKTGEKYDACDDLEKRLTDISALSSLEQESEKEALSSTATSPDKSIVRPVNAGEDILEQCQNILYHESADDVYGRNILSYLQGGLARCNENKSVTTLASFDIDDLHNVYDKVKKQQLVRDLNLLALRRNLEAMLILEHSFMYRDGNFPQESFPIENKQEFKRKVMAQFKDLNPRKEYHKEIKQLVDEVYAQFTRKKSLLKKQKFADNFATLKEDAHEATDSVNKYCQSVYQDYRKQFKDQIRGPWTEWARSYTEAEKRFFKEKNKEIYKRVERSFKRSKMGFLLGTNVFKKEVMDPSTDYAKTCAKSSSHYVINPHFYKKQYHRALEEARSKLYASLKGARKSILGLDQSVKNYLKNDKQLFLQLLKALEGDEQAQLAKYICARTKEVYDNDEILEVGGIVGGAFTSLTGGILAIAGGLSCPSSGGAGCAIAGLGGKMALAGTAAMGGASGVKIYDAQKEVALTNIVQLTNDAHTTENFVLQSKQASNRKKDGLLTAATVVAGTTLSAGVNTYLRASYANRFANISKMNKTSPEATSKSTELGPVVVESRAYAKRPYVEVDGVWISTADKSKKFVDDGFDQLREVNVARAAVKDTASNHTEKLLSAPKAAPKISSNLPRKNQNKEIAPLSLGRTTSAASSKTTPRASYSIISDKPIYRVKTYPIALNPKDFDNNQQYLKTAFKQELRIKAKTDLLPSDIFNEKYSTKTELLTHLKTLVPEGELPPEKEFIKSLKNDLKKLEKIRDNKIKMKQLEKEIQLLKDMILLLEENR